MRRFSEWEKYRQVSWLLLHGQCVASWPAFCPLFFPEYNNYIIIINKENYTKKCVSLTRREKSFFALNCFVQYCCNNIKKNITRTRKQNIGRCVHYYNFRQLWMQNRKLSLNWCIYLCKIDKEKISCITIKIIKKQIINWRYL